MARIVLGIGTSHSPLVVVEPALWSARGDADRLLPLLLRAAKRYIGGSSRSECVAVAAKLNAAGHAATMDYMGAVRRRRAR